MKILIIANGVDEKKPGISGGEMRFLEIAKHWESLGHSIEMLTNTGGQRLCGEMGLKIEKFHIYPSMPSVGRLNFIYKAFQTLFYMPNTVQNFKGIVYSTNEMVFDVIPGLKLKISNGCKWAVVVHWLPPFPPWRRHNSTKINSTLFFLNQRLSLLISNRFADKLLAVSKATGRDLKAWGGDRKKIEVVECGVNLNQIKSLQLDGPINEKKYDAVFMKRLQAVKGVFDAIKIWKIVVEKKPDAQLLIIGEGIDGEAAQKLSEEYGLTKNITFTGAIFDFKEKFTLLHKSKAFILPTYEENWAIVIGEALGAGLPVVTYRLIELEDVWGDSIRYAEVGNISQFSDILIKLISSVYNEREVLKNMSSVEKYGWENISNKELSIINE